MNNITQYLALRYKSTLLKYINNGSYRKTSTIK